MPAQVTPEAPPPPSRKEIARILQDTARAVKVMKASWLHVALNLKRIREHKLWQFSEPPCSSYDEYVLDVLQLNRYVAHRMMTAFAYTEERRPDILERFAQRGDSADIPSYEVINQLRRVQSSFGEREDDFDDLESRVFDGGIGRVNLKRAIDEKLGVAPDSPDGEASKEKAAPEPATLDSVIATLREVERQLIELKVSKEARQLAFRLVETLQKEKRQAE